MYKNETCLLTYFLNVNFMLECCVLKNSKKFFAFDSQLKRHIISSTHRLYKIISHPQKDQSGQDQGENPWQPHLFDHKMYLEKENMYLMFQIQKVLLIQHW